MNYTARVYQALEPLTLTGAELDTLKDIKGGDFRPSSDEAFSAKLDLLADNTEELLKLLSKLPKQDEPLHNDYVDFLFSLKDLHPDYSYGQLVSMFLLSKLEERSLSIVQRNNTERINGSHNEPKFPSVALEEVMELLTDEGSTEELIRTLKALPRPAQIVALPDGARPDDRDWRICESGMYKIIDKDGNLCSFFPNYSQRIVYELWKVNPRLAILKSRQLGISTLFLVIAGDMCIFSKYKSAGLVAQDKKSSGTLFKKVDVILDNLPEWVYSHLNMTVDTNNSEELRFSNGSVLYISSSFRSSTLQLLHISEVSSIGLKDPAKIEELKTGSMQTVSSNSNNSIVMESTAKSGVDYFATVYQKAALGLNAFTAVFLSWVNDPSSVMSECPLPINSKYFENVLPELIEAKIVDEDFEFTQEQKNFYTMKKDELGDEKIGQEYPTVARESFEAHFAGSILGKQLLRYKVNHSVPLVYNPRQPLYAALDLGQADYTVVIFFQLYKERGIEVIHCLADRGEPISYYIEAIEEYLEFLRAEYNPALRMKEVFLPHDGKNKNISARKSVLKQVSEHYKARAEKSATPSVVNDLAVVNDMLPYIKFNAESQGVLQLLDNLRSYSWKYTAGSYSNTPDHASGSDFADAFRTMVMSPIVNSTKSIAKWKNAIRELTLEQEKQIAILEGQGKEVTIINGEIYTGDAGYRREAIRDAEEFEREVKANTRNSTIADSSSSVQDGIDMGGGETNWDLRNEQFTKENGGSFTPKEKDPYSKGWI